MTVKNIKFPMLPIYRWIEFDYINADCVADLVEVWHLWMGVAETTKNKVKANAYFKSANALYQELTGMSYQSKITI